MGSTRKFRVITRFVKKFFQGCGPEKGLVWIVPSFHKQRMNEYMKRTLPCQHMLGLEMLGLSSFIHCHICIVRSPKKYQSMILCDDVTRCLIFFAY